MTIKQWNKISGVHTNQHVTLSNTAGDDPFFTQRASETRRRDAEGNRDPKWLAHED